MDQQAVIVLHEIYGINGFVKSTCEKFKNAGFDVFCPDMLGGISFPYEKAQKAYDHFTKHVGFEVYKEISESIKSLKEKYKKVFMVGFSIGATVAWRCCENSLCDGIVACYGSRIRDYANLNPACPILLLLAKEDSFDVNSLVGKLNARPHLVIHEFDARHGFIDSFNKYYDSQASKSAEKLIFNFLTEYGS